MRKPSAVISTEGRNPEAFELRNLHHMLSAYEGPSVSQTDHYQRSNPSCFLERTRLEPGKARIFFARNHVRGSA
jgi:hypothetical protein